MKLFSLIFGHWFMMIHLKWILETFMHIFSTVSFHSLTICPGQAKPQFVYYFSCGNDYWIFYQSGQSKAISRWISYFIFFTLGFKPGTSIGRLCMGHMNDSCGMTHMNHAGLQIADLFLKQLSEFRCWSQTKSNLSNTNGLEW